MSLTLRRRAWQCGTTAYRRPCLLTVRSVVTTSDPVRGTRLCDSLLRRRPDHIEPSYSRHTEDLCHFCPVQITPPGIDGWNTAMPTRNAPGSAHRTRPESTRRRPSGAIDPRIASRISKDKWRHGETQPSPAMIAEPGTAPYRPPVQVRAPYPQAPRVFTLRRLRQPRAT